MREDIIAQRIPAFRQNKSRLDTGAPGKKEKMPTGSRRSQKDREDADWKSALPVR
jgi:hypothetical protein